QTSKIMYNIVRSILEQGSDLMLFGFDAMILGMSSMMRHRMNYGADLMKHLSSGSRICSAADDAAGLCISQGMKAQIRGMNQASRNVQDTVSMLQVADGNLEQTHSILQRLKELVVQAANDTNSTTDRANIQTEIDELVKEVSRISTSANFNTKNLLDGSLSSGGSGMTVQIGANAGESQQIFIENMGASALGIDSINVVGASGTAISSYSTTVDAAIAKVSTQRAIIGAKQNVLEMRMDYLDTTAINLQEAESRISDTDMAQTMMEYTKNNILMQALQTMMAQAMNSHKEMVSALLQSL
ncbi:MAG TPA: flagellin, partial [Clostridia bacterium]|nr:flagellin [Clostridia bacterium]